MLNFVSLKSKLLEFSLTMSDPKEPAFTNLLRMKRELDTCIVTILGSFFRRNVLLFSVLEKDRVGAHSRIDGDCDVSC